MAKPYRYNPDLKRNNIVSVTAAENEKFALQWSSDNSSVLLIDKEDGSVYSNIPSGYAAGEGFEDESDSLLKMKSPICIDCVRSETYEIKTGYAAESINSGDYSVSLIEGGIRVTYIFDELKVSIPVKYMLFDDGLNIVIDTSKIAEDGGEYFIHSVAIAPFICSAKNMSKKSYLFYPSGSGALISMNSQKDISVNYSSEVFGRDRMSDVPTWCVETNEEYVRMPVFGSKNGKNGMFSIIDKGAETGTITLDAFNKNIGYSAVYPQFSLRGATSVSNAFLSSAVNSIKYSDYLYQGEISVLYYPLKGKNASYNGMADIYRNYLKNAGMTQKSNNNALSVKVLGGAMVDSKVLGIPKRKFFATTTTAEAEDIIKDINKTIGAGVNADFVGYGETGLEIGELGGGFTVAEELGGKKGLKNAYDNLSAEQNSVYFDFDPVSINSSGSGYSSVFDVAVTTTRQRGAENSYLLGTNNRKKINCYYISRSLLTEVIDKMIVKFRDMGINGVAFDALASYSYSDYSEQKYYAKGNMGKDVSDALKKCADNSLSVMTNAANIYAAVCSDLVVDVPLQSSKADFFSSEIPFYQMVLRGYVPMYSPSLNLSNNSTELLLKSIEAGTGISYTVIKNFDGKLRKEFDIYQNVCYDDLKDTISKNYAYVSDYLEKINGCEISKHRMIKKGISSTTFSNGITVYVNYGESSYKTPLGTLKAKSFIYGIPKEEGGDKS
ncbi:MAG: hypothetical protein J5852_03755 [Clostridia bacterium]|nr:hypothetical protein [Clostridia bacterium]